MGEGEAGKEGGGQARNLGGGGLGVGLDGGAGHEGWGGWWVGWGGMNMVGGVGTSAI